MNTRQLALILRDLNECKTPQAEEAAFHALDTELKHDGLEVVVDEDKKFSVRYSPQRTIGTPEWWNAQPFGPGRQYDPRDATIQARSV